MCGSRVEVRCVSSFAQHSRGKTSPACLTGGSSSAAFASGLFSQLGEEGQGRGYLMYKDHHMLLDLVILPLPLVA